MELENAREERMSCHAFATRSPFPQTQHDIKIVQISHGMTFLK